LLENSLVAPTRSADRLRNVSVDEDLLS